MNDDIISREALKKALEVTQYNDIDDLTRTERLIDDASPVEPELSNELNKKIETYKNAYRIMSDAFENEVRKNKRPQGEWVIDGHHYKCSRCGKTLVIMFSETDDGDLIGCPFCLADMRVNGGRE